eukprot:s1557_g13.t1
MFHVNVSFPSSSGETLLLPEGSKVRDLKLLAQRSLGRGFLKLISVDGHVLTNLDDSLQAAGVKDGEHLTAVAQQPKVAASGRAFALWCVGGNQVVTWGKEDQGGDSSTVQDQLRNVQQIQATHFAFAAILADGSVVTWGDPRRGGDCLAVQDQLRNVQQIQATGGAFAAILADGSVVTWGDPDYIGDCSAVQDQLVNVQHIQAACGGLRLGGFAAILADGSVVTWGNPDRGGNCSAVQDQLRNVQEIQSTSFAFAAILADGSAAAWGNPRYGGDCSAVQDQLVNVQHIQATSFAFAAVLADGSVVAWGHQVLGGDCSKVQDQLRNVQQIQATKYGAFAVILADGSVVTWGDPRRGGDCSAVQDQLRNVQQIQATESAFAAILADGSVVAWGDPNNGGDCSALQDQLRKVQQIEATADAFAAILADGSVVTWGSPGRWVSPTSISKGQVPWHPLRCRMKQSYCPLIQMDHGQLLSLSKERYLESTAELGCAEGYEASGGFSSFTCHASTNSTGAWRASDGTSDLTQKLQCSKISQYCPTPMPPEGTHFLMSAGLEMDSVLTFACALAYEANVALEYPAELFCLPGIRDGMEDIGCQSEEEIVLLVSLPVWNFQAATVDLLQRHVRIRAHLLSGEHPKRSTAPTGDVLGMGRAFAFAERLVDLVL